MAHSDQVAMKLSIVSTLYNSEKTVAEFIERIGACASRSFESYEIVLVDDGSKDGTMAAATDLLRKHRHIRLLELSRNFGHHRAMMTGLMAAVGDLVFLIDSDLDEPPELLDEFRQVIDRSSADVVYGYQQDRKGKLIERVGGRFAWFLIDAVSEIKIPRNLSTVRLMRRPYVDALVQHREQMTAIGGLWAMTGFRQVGCVIRKKMREETTYSLRRRAIALLDSLTSFSERPLYFVFLLGVGIFLLSTVVALTLIVWRLSGTVMDGWVSILVSVWLLGGLITLCVGVVGLYISRIFIETKARPYSIVRSEQSSD